MVVWRFVLNFQMSAPAVILLVSCVMVMEAEDMGCSDTDLWILLRLNLWPRKK